MNPETSHREGTRWALALALLMLLMLWLFPPRHNGDVAEYSLTTIAVASHGTPDIRLDDIATAKRLLPQLVLPYEELERDMRANRPKVYAAFVRGRDGKVYSVHFFGYPALAALPYKVLELAGANPMQCYQVLNLAAIFILGLALYRLFGSAPRAALGLALFMLCGGALYWDWSSPECVSAAALLAGMIFFVRGAPLAGALLAGLAGQQNPTIVFFFGFAPLLKLCLDYQRGTPWRVTLLRAFNKRDLIGLGAGMALFALPPLFNLWQFGVPNIIAKLFSDPTLISLTRLHSFYFDLNQGMIIAIPAVLAALALWGWRAGAGARHHALVLALCAGFTLALALPALAVLNWNSGATGVMRYAFWAAMPLLFALFWRMQAQPRWPVALVLGVLLAQGGAMWHATSYMYTEFSPAARLMFSHAPGLYHPEPEIFAERLGGHDNYIYPHHVVVRRVDGKRVTTLFNRDGSSDARLCGPDGILAPGNRISSSARGWRYIDGEVLCSGAGRPQQSFQIEHFQGSEGVVLGSGWSTPEANGGVWDGVWSNGARSQLVLTPNAGIAPATLFIAGHYFDGNQRTRVIVNGTDLGWHRLDQTLPIALPTGAAPLTIELEHDAPARPPGDPRTLAFFMRSITLR